MSTAIAGYFCGVRGLGAVFSEKSSVAKETGIIEPGIFLIRFVVCGFHRGRVLHRIKELDSENR